MLPSLVLYVLAVSHDWFDEGANLAKRMCEPLGIIAAADVFILNTWRLIKGGDAVVRQSLGCYKEIRTSKELKGIVRL